MFNPEEQYQNELRARLEVIKFPADDILYGFRVWLQKALRQENCRSLQCDWNTFKELLTLEPSEFNLYQMSFAINAVTFRTPAELMISMEEYVALGDQMHQMASVWNSMVEPVRTSLNRKISAQMQIKKPIGRA